MQTEEPQPDDARDTVRGPRRFVIDPVHSSGEPIYDLESGSLLESMVRIDYDAHDVTSQLPELQVLTPDGQGVSATFDLNKLR